MRPAAAPLGPGRQKSSQRDLTNLAHLPAKLIEALRTGLSGKPLLISDEDLELVRALPRSHVATLSAQARSLPDRSRDGRHVRRGRRGARLPSRRVGPRLRSSASGRTRPRASGEGAGGADAPRLVRRLEVPAASACSPWGGRRRGSPQPRRSPRCPRAPRSDCRAPLGGTLSPWPGRRPRRPPLSHSSSLCRAPPQVAVASSASGAAARMMPSASIVHQRAPWPSPRSSAGISPAPTTRSSTGLPVTWRAARSQPPSASSHASSSAATSAVLTARTSTLPRRLPRPARRSRAFGVTRPEMVRGHPAVDAATGHPPLPERPERTPPLVAPAPPVPHHGARRLGGPPGQRLVRLRAAAGCLRPARSSRPAGRPSRPSGSDGALRRPDATAVRPDGAMPRHARRPPASSSPQRARPASLRPLARRKRRAHAPLRIGAAHPARRGTRPPGRRSCYERSPGRTGGAPAEGARHDRLGSPSPTAPSPRRTSGQGPRPPAGRPPTRSGRRD